jgi:hypothetical protein
LSREEAAQQRGKKLLQAVAGIRPGSKATASWGVIRHQKVRVFAGLYSMKEMMAPERRHGDSDVPGTKPLCDAQAHPSGTQANEKVRPHRAHAAIVNRARKRPREH